MASWRRFASLLALATLLHLAAARATRADVVLDWNAIAVNTAIANGQNPFALARAIAVVQLAVFEAVNSIAGEYEPYLGTISAPADASADAAAIAAAHRVLVAYFPASITALDAERDAFLASIAEGAEKQNGIAAGIAAADAMIALRANDGSAAPPFFVPDASAPGVWQATPTCPSDPTTGLAVGTFHQWGDVVPFGIPSAADFIPGPPPSLGSSEYRKDYFEVATVGGADSTARPPDRTDVVRFYAVSSPTLVFNSLARQFAAERGDSLSENARNLAVINMAINDALIVSFATKYQYVFWRPETAIHAGDTDGNDRTAADAAFAPFIPTPCFPSYPSNHASGSTAGAESLRRIYGAGGHDITLENPAVPGLVLHYTTLKQITEDVDDARVYGGIHFRFDQEAGGRLGRAVATYISKEQLVALHGSR